VKVGASEDFPAVLERLRGNINDERWQRKITYFHSLCALWPDWNEVAGTRELSKLLPFDNETDVEILQLYLDLFKKRLDFSTRQNVIDRIVYLSDRKIDRLHYRGLRAIDYFLIGDEKKAESELTEAINEYRTSRKEDKETTYNKYRLAEALGLLGTIQADTAILDEALAEYEDLLVDEEWTSAGRASLYCSVGDVYRQKAEWKLAVVSYQKALQLDPREIFKVFLSQCYFQLENVKLATEVIKKVNQERLNDAEMVDYALGFGAIAVGLADAMMLDQSEKLLRSLPVDSAYFGGRRDAMLIAVLDTRVSGGQIQ
jgi:tetratricopeptide (TPR) repeat protein